MADGFEKKRSNFEFAPERPADPPPPPSASMDEREDWSGRAVAWFLSMTGGDPDLEGVPSGHRWRTEYFECVRDPQAFWKYAEEEIRAYQAQVTESDDGEGN